jgi:hypothetical protein
MLCIGESHGVDYAKDRYLLKRGCITILTFLGSRRILVDDSWLALPMAEKLGDMPPPPQSPITEFLKILMSSTFSWL